MLGCERGLPDMNRLSALCLALMLAACASTPAPAPASPPQTALPPPVKQVCIPVTPWTMQQQADLANALAPIPETSPIVRLLLDWEKMRDEAKACIKARR